MTIIIINIASVIRITAIRDRFPMENHFLYIRHKSNLTSPLKLPTSKKTSEG